MSNTTIVPGAGALTSGSSASGLGFNLITTVGALALAGVAPPLYYNVQGNTAFTPLAGSLALSTNVSMAITPAVGALNVDLDAGGGVSYRPTVNTGLLVAPSAGALAMATFGISSAIVPGTGSLSIRDPSDQVHTMTPDAGAIGFDADAVNYSPALVIGVFRVPFPGALGFDLDGSSYVPGQLLTLPPPATASLSFVGLPPVIGSASVRIVEPAGALAFAGAPPQISVRRILTPAAGALGFTGNSSNETLGYGIAPPAGALTLAGEFAATSKTRVGLPGALALRGVAPILRQNTLLIVPSGVLGFPGVVPGRVAIQPVAIPITGALGMAGYAPILSTSQTIVPDYGVIGVYGRAPTVEAPVQITPFPGAMGFAGNQPAQAPTALYQVDPYYYVPGRTPGITTNWPTLSASESVIGTFNFGDELEAGELLLGPINLVIQVSAGADVNPMHIVNGPLALDPTQMMVFVPIANGTPGVTYYFIVNVQTTNPYKKLTRYALLPITAAATPGVNSTNQAVTPNTGGLITVGTSAGRVP